MPEVYNTRSLHIWLWGCEYVLRVKSIFRLIFLFARARYDDFNYVNKRAEMQDEKKFSYDQIQFVSSNTSVSVTTIKPLSTKMASS